MHTRRLAAASTLVLALCSLQGTNAAACDYGCSGCGGYGYSALSYAYSSYPAYGYFAPVNYLPTYPYAYHPVAYYNVGPGYGPTHYAPPIYGHSYQPNLRDYYWRGGYVSAPNVDTRTRMLSTDGRPALRGYSAAKQTRALKGTRPGPNPAPQVKKPVTPLPIGERPKATVDVQATAFGLKPQSGSPTHLRRAELQPPR
jgi:hypothetical protein